MMFILDDSGSVNATELQQQRAAVMTMLQYFVNNNISARAAIVRFSTSASTVINYTNVTSANLTTFQTALNNNYGVGGLTNWESGFQQAVSLGISAGSPDVTFFFTDGEINNGGSPNNEATQLKNVGAHIYGIGIQDPALTIDDFTGVSDGSNTSQFSGSNAYTADYVPVTSFSTLGAQMTALVQAMCPQGGSISGTLYQDTDGNNTLGAGETRLPANIDVELLNSSGAVLATTTTDGNGNFSFPYVSPGSNYRVRAVTSDPQVPSGLVIGTTNPIADINITAGSSITNQNFGFDTPHIISGTVFEDVNYGGGAGRSLSGSAGIGRGGTTVELYDSAGILRQTTTTSTAPATLGQYSFNVSSGDYTVRVVNSSVTSSRTGYIAGLLPVQTFRTAAGTIAGTVTPVTNRVGGEKPAEVDAGAGTVNTTNLTTLNAGTNEAQSITAVKVGSSSVTGLDFGYNFDTTVNTNNSGQGSLRQFIINSNALGGEGSLTQVGQPAGFETSIFMIPNGIANPGQNNSFTNQLNANGVAVIDLTSSLPTITDTRTRLDGATQTANVKTAGSAETNPGQLGTSGTVGIDKISLLPFNRPEIEIKGQFTLTATGSYTEIKNIAFNAQRVSVSGQNSLVQDNLVGMPANGAGDATTAGVTSHGIDVGAGSDIIIRHNYIRVNESGIRRNNNGTRLTIEFNEVDLPSSGQSTTYDGILLIGSGSSDIIRNNLAKNMRGAGLELGFTGGTLTNTLVENNTFLRNGYNGTSPSTETMGVVAYSAPNSTISLRKNIITGNSGPGVVVLSTTGVQLSQNSFFNNGASGNGAGSSIDLDANTRDPNAYNAANGVTPNNGTVSASLPNGDMDYPIFTKAQLSANTLELKGYIGTNPAGNTAFAGATIEIYKADDDSNQNGAVIAGDGLSNPHGEGRYYIGSITADANGLFDTTLTIPASLTDGINTTTLSATDKITAIATSRAAASIAPLSTSEFSSNTPLTVPVTTSPNVLLVKRITAIGGNPISTYINEPTNPYDDNVLEPALAPQPPNYPTVDTTQWPNTPNATTSTFLVGSINGGKVRPKDTIEYTIYFLSAGTQAANSVLFCDRVPDHVTFLPSAFNTSMTADTSGILGADRGIAINLGGTLKAYTNLNDGDIAYYYPPGSNPISDFPKISCGGSNTNGAVVVNLGNLPNATAPGVPASSYGFVRFRGQVK